MFHLTAVNGKSSIYFPQVLAFLQSGSVPELDMHESKHFLPGQFVHSAHMSKHWLVETFVSLKIEIHNIKYVKYIIFSS